MTYDEFNEFCSALPATSHVIQWGESHVWKVGEKVFAIGGWGVLEILCQFFNVQHNAEWRIDYDRQV